MHKMHLLEDISHPKVWCADLSLLVKIRFGENLDPCVLVSSTPLTH